MFKFAKKMRRSGTKVEHSSLNCFQRRVAGSSRFASHRTVDLWSRTLRIEEIAE